ncbi:MAG: hypothetical protein KME14_09065 [Tildeniella torsiva UHER 1998/13D]|nr:hypothetical protein [Tildeniella torsiva UHER 1998/13D]
MKKPIPAKVAPFEIVLHEKGGQGSPRKQEISLPLLIGWVGPIEAVALWIFGVTRGI